MSPEPYPVVEKPFGKALAALGERFPELVVVDADLVRATDTAEFRSRFPSRHWNVGVAEANMVGIATGLALSGKTAFCGTFACFASQRVCDQAVLAAYCRAPVVICGVEPALTSGSNGATHQGMLDLAIMRAIPNMRVFEAADATETASMVEYALLHPGTTYMRVPRGKAPVILDPDTYRFEAGRAVRLCDGADVTLIASGIMLARALQAAQALAAEGIEARVVNMSSLKPIDEAAILSAAHETGCLVTAENHSLVGGLGSAVAEVLASRAQVPLVRVGVQDAFGEVGPIDWLADKFGISSAHIARAAREAISLKAGKGQLART
jgi:transketolase